MTEKKTTSKAAATKAPAAKKTTTKKSVKKASIFVDAENAGFRAGDVYNALAAAGEALSVEELAKTTGKTETEILLGIGWLLKELKVKGAEGKVVLA
jgi:cell wall-associated NlpC family hydrolase